MTGTVRTVLGDVEASSLGRTDYHEHLFQVSPLLPGDELDDLDLALRETELYRDSGFDAMVDLTPIGLGRRPAWLQEVSRRTGVQIVAATGVHRPEHYAAGHPVRGWDVERLAERFVEEITVEISEGAGPDLRPTGADDAQGAAAGHGVRAGVIKAGTGYWEISDHSRRVLEAAGIAHRRTGAPVVCHLELGTAAFEVAEVLEQAGVPREHVILGHMDRNPDVGLHAELAASGVYLGYDGAARAKYWPDSVLLGCLLEVARRGGGARLLLGADVARRGSFVAAGGLPGMAYLGDRFVPRLRAEGGEDLVRQVLVSNPAAAFSLAATAVPSC